MTRKLLLLLCTLSLYAPYTVYDAMRNFLKTLQAYQANQNADTAQVLVNEYDSPNNTDKYRRIFDGRLQRAGIDLNVLRAQAVQKKLPQRAPTLADDTTVATPLEEVTPAAAVTPQAPPVPSKEPAVIIPGTMADQAQVAIPVANVLRPFTPQKITVTKAPETVTIQQPTDSTLIAEEIEVEPFKPQKITEMTHQEGTQVPSEEEPVVAHDPEIQEKIEHLDSEQLEKVDEETKKLDTETLDELAIQLNQPETAAELIKEAEQVAGIAQEQADAQEKLVGVADALVDNEKNFIDNIKPVMGAALAEMERKAQSSEAQLEQVSKNIRSHIEYMHKSAQFQVEAHRLEVQTAELQSQKLASELKIKNIEVDLLNQREKVLADLLSEKRPTIDDVHKQAATEIKKLETRDIRAGLKPQGQRSLMRKRQLIHRINSWKAASSQAKKTADALFAEQNIMDQVRKELKSVSESLRDNAKLQQTLKESLPSSGKLQAPAFGQQVMTHAIEAEWMLDTVRKALGRGAEKIDGLVGPAVKKIGTPAEMTQQMQDSFKKASERLTQQQNALKIRSSSLLAQAGQRASQASTHLGAATSSRLQPQLTRAAQGMETLTTRLGSLAESPAAQQTARTLMRAVKFIAK